MWVLLRASCFQILSAFFILILKTIKREIILHSPAGKTQTNHDVWGHARNLEKGRLRLFLMLLNYPGLLFNKVQG